jgi:mRNA-degrading endonuclease YafQ of YafQ-DinJ toxin-antitoxin module
MVERIESFQFSKRFKKEFKKLPQNIQKSFNEKLSLLLQNMLHPSLRVKRIQGTKDRWEGSVTMKYRFTFELIEDTIIFRAIGTHDILNK